MLDQVLKTARTYTKNRIAEKLGFNSRAKLGVKDIAQELEYAVVFGELSCLERITAVLVSNPDMKRADIEAEIHLSIVAYHDYLRKNVGNSKTRITLDRYLEMRGYTGDKGIGAQIQDS